MWFKRTIAVCLFVTLTGILGIGFGAVAFTKEPTVTVLNPDGSTRQVTPDEAAKNPQLIEQSTSSSDNTDGTSPEDSPSTPSPNDAPPTSNPASPTPTTPTQANPSPSPSQSLKPVVSLSIQPSVITSGGSSTLQWSVTNNPTSCNATGAWSGAKSSSGIQGTGTKTTGSYVYTLTCSNAGGSSGTSVTLTVNAPAINYCDGLSPCYGVSQMAQHASSSTCWGYSTYQIGGSFARTYDLVKAYNGTAKHRQSGVGFYVKCGADITSCINGQTGCGSVVKNHSADKLLQYSSPNGYYDPRKP